MAFAGRMRSSLPLVSKLFRSDSIAATGSRWAALQFAPPNSNSEQQFSTRNFATATTGYKEEIKVKVPLALFGGSGNYASALYLAAVKANALDKVESELIDLSEAIKKSLLFSQFTKDLSVPTEIQVKAINDISAHAKLSDITKNFLRQPSSPAFVELLGVIPLLWKVFVLYMFILAENGRLRYIDTIAERFVELTMAHKGEVKAIVTTVIPLPPAEEKELKDTLQEIIGHGKKVKLEQKIDTSILGGLVVEFGEKVFDMSIKTRALQMERFLREPINIGSL
ncbi:ATPase, OSCP/delta subunit [Trema orientale]|uniref:ATPase, OSCP/delta subunit n=1 Tax=Trema orientale TaxID=63057 RepID=A0A2P5E719_TREOI|nr:ATPase, OSCP/delta subunit [Trema orientale]